MQQLPVLDITPFLKDPDSLESHRFVIDLREACHDIGFAHLIGHDISPTIEQRLLQQSERFFDLPLDERRALALANSAAFRGYTSVGDERTRGESDWREQLDFGPEQATPPVGHSGPAWLRLRGPNQWPPSLPELGPVALEWMDAMHGFGVQVLRALALGLGQPSDHFDAGFIPDHDLHAKIIRYPAGNPSSNQGVGLHHDSGVLTFILQHAVAGLEVPVHGEMTLVEPLPGAYVMNLGAMLQTATNGYLRATPHRVISPTGDDDRISLALFFNPAFETSFEPFGLPAELASLARPEALDLKGEPIHTLFGENNLKVRLRSHPDVAARHYSDVLQI